MRIRIKTVDKTPDKEHLLLPVLQLSESKRHVSLNSLKAAEDVTEGRKYLSFERGRHCKTPPAEVMLQPNQTNSFLVLLRQACDS